jgi:hypothetical protein
MKETIRRKENNIIAFNIIYISKKVIPQGNFFYFIFFLLKFWGILIISNTYIKKSDNDNFYINDWLSVITLYKIYETDKINYSTACILIYILILLPVLGYIAIYYQKTKKKNIKFTKMNRRLIKLLAVLTYIILLLYQHIVEFLGYIYLHQILIITKDTGYVLVDKLPLIEVFANSLNNKHFLLVFNMVFIIFLNVLLYQFIMLVNEPFIDSKSPIKVYNNRNFIMLLVFVTNYQAVSNYYRFFTDEIASMITLCLCGVFLFINIIMMINFIRKFHYITFFKMFLILVLNYTFFSTLINIALYHLYDESVTAKVIELNTILACIFSVIITHITIITKRGRNLRNFANHLFLKVPKKVESYLAFTEKLNECISHPHKIYDLYELITQHQSKCNAVDCNCRDFNINDFAGNFVNFNNSPNIVTNEVLNNFKHYFEEIILLVENEIVNFIHHEYKGKDVKNSFNIFILHIDYIFHFRKNYLLVNFLIENYLNTIRDLPFSFKLFFFLFKKKVYKHHYLHLGQKNKKNLVLCDFYNYFNTIENIKKVILKNLNDFIEFIDIKKLYDSKKELNRMHMLADDGVSSSSYNISGVIDVCKNLQKHYKKVKIKLKKTFSKSILKNLELCYIITQYYTLVNKTIPEKVAKCFLEINNLHELNLDVSTYKEKNFNHPIIIQNIKDNFKIVFICQKLCDKLGYQRNKLIGEDFEIFFPEQMAHNHTILMKKTLFLENNTVKIIKDVFILTKDKYLLPINLIATSLPMLYQNTLIIMDIKEIALISNNYCTVYNIILDNQLNIMTFSRPFFNNFLGGVVTVEFLKKFNLTFGQIFEINLDKLKTIFEESIKYIKEVNLKNFNSIINIFQPIALRNTMKYTKDMRAVNKQLSIKFTDLPQMIEFNRNKEILKNSYEKLTRLLYESNVDKEAIQSLNNIYKRFLVQTTANKLSPVVGKIKRQATDKVVFENQDTVDSISIRIDLLNIGNFQYYKVTLIDYELYYKNLSSLVSGRRCSLKTSYGGIKHSTNNYKRLADDFLLIPELPTELLIAESHINTKIEVKDNTTTSRPTTTGRFVPNSPTPMLNTNNRSNEVDILTKNPNGSLQVSMNVLKAGHNTSLNDTLGFLLKGRKEELNKMRDLPKRNHLVTKKTIKFNESVLLVSITVIATIVVIMTLYNFKLSDAIIEQSLYLILTKVYFYHFNSAIVYSSNSLMGACVVKNRNVTQILMEEKEILQTSLNKMITYGNYLPRKYNTQLIITVLTPSPFNFILDDWTTYSKLSNMAVEINTYSYHMAKFGYSHEGCDISTVLPSSNKQAGKSSPTDKLIYYTMNNVFQIFLKNNDALNSIFDNAIVEDLINIDNEYFIFDLLFYTLCIVLIILTLITLFTFESKIGKLIFFIFIKNRNDSRFEKKLTTFKKLVEDSDKEAFKTYDKMLTYNNRILNKFITNTGLNDSTSSIIHGISLFNDAEYETGNTNDDNELEHTPRFKIKLLRLSILFLVISLISIIAIGMSSLLIGKKYIELLLITKDIVSNSMERLMNLSQLILYFQISVIASNTRLITFPQTNYRNFNNYFEVQQDVSKDSVFETLGDSLYNDFYYLLGSNRKNLQMFWNTAESNEILLNLKNLEGYVNKELCDYLANNTSINVSDCETIGHGITKLGLEYAIDSIVNYITKIYLDFEKSTNKDPTSALNQQKFVDSLITNDEYFRLLNNLNTEIILTDVPEIYHRLHNKRLIYACISFVINICLIIYAALIIIPKLKGYYNSLHYALKKLKRASQK